MKPIFSIFLIVILLVSVFGIAAFAAENNVDTAPFIKQIREELMLTKALTEKQVNRMMNQVQKQFNQMVKSGVSQDKMEEVANQVRQTIQIMANNQNELSRLSNAVSFISKECVKGKDPHEVGNMLQQRLRDGYGINGALKQTRIQLQEQDRIMMSNAEKDSSDSGSSNSGNGGGGNSGGSNSENGGGGNSSHGGR
jgi:uncharacterized membrane protein YgcG